MNSYRILFTFSLAVLLCMPALAQQRPTSGVVAQPAPETSTISASDVRILGGDALRRVDTPSRSVVFDTLNYNTDEAFDTLFFVALTTFPFDPATQHFYAGTLEFDQLFTPGEGTGGFFGPNGTALPAQAGQKTEFGFCLGGPDPVQGDADDILAFFVSKVEQGDDVGPTPYPASVFGFTLDNFLDTITPNDPSDDAVNEGVCYTLDLSDDNIFFEADEEMWEGFFVVDNSTENNLEVQFLLDDGNIGTEGDPNYDPVRSLLFAEPPFVPEFGLYSWNGSSNYLWYDVVDYKSAPVVDGDITAACGFLGTCNFQAGDTFTYTGCVRNNSGAPRRATATVQAFLPNGATRTLLSLNTPTLPSGPRVCRTFSARIPAQAPDGFYAVQLLIDDPAGVDFTYDTDRVFFTKGAPAPARTAAFSRADLMNVEPQVSAEWTAEATGDWEVIETDVTAAAARGETASVVGAFPNPFARETTIRFTAAEATALRLAVYDVMGREVAVLADGTVEAGQHDVVFDARGLASGLYVYRLTAGSQVETGRITLLK